EACERDFSSVWRPHRVVVGQTTELLPIATIGVHHNDLITETITGRKGDLGAVGRPGGRIEKPHSAFDQCRPIAAIGVHHVDISSAAGESDLRAIRGPCRVKTSAGRACELNLIAAIGVHDPYFPGAVPGTVKRDPGS